MEFSLTADKHTLVLENFERSLKLWYVVNDEYLQTFMRTPMLYDDCIQSFNERHGEHMRTLKKDAQQLDTEANEILDQATQLHQTVLDSIKLGIGNDADLEKVVTDVHALIDKSVTRMKGSRALYHQAEEKRNANKVKEATVKKLVEAKIAEMRRLVGYEQKGHMDKAASCRRAIDLIDQDYDKFRRRDFLYLTRWLDSRPGRATCNRDELGTEACEYISFFSDNGPQNNITHVCINAFQSMHSACSQYAKISKDIKDGHIDRASTLFELSYDNFTKLALQDMADLHQKITARVERLALEQNMAEAFGTTASGQPLSSSQKRKPALHPDTTKFLVPMKATLEKLETLYEEIISQVRPHRVDHVDRTGLPVEPIRPATQQPQQQQGSGVGRIFLPVFERISSVLVRGQSDESEEERLESWSNASGRAKGSGSTKPVINIKGESAVALSPGTPYDESLHDAVMKPDMRRILEILDDPSVDVNCPDSNKWSPLHTATHHGHVDVALLLMKRGANPAMVNSNGAMPLHYLCGKSILDNKEGFMRLLHRLGKATGVNARNNSGETPIFYTVRHDCDMDVLQFLLSHGADVTVRTKRGMTILDLVKAMNRDENVLNLLETLFTKQMAEKQKVVEAENGGSDGGSAKGVPLPPRRWESSSSSAQFVCKCENAEALLSTADDASQIILRVWVDEKAGGKLGRIKERMVKTFVVRKNTTAGQLKSAAARKFGIAESDVDLLTISRLSRGGSGGTEGCSMRPVDDSENLYEQLDAMQRRKLAQTEAEAEAAAQGNPSVGIGGARRQLSMPGVEKFPMPSPGPETLEEEGEESESESGSRVILEPIDGPSRHSLEKAEDGDFVFLFFGDTFLEIELIHKEDMADELHR